MFLYRCFGIVPRFEKFSVTNGNGSSAFWRLPRPKMPWTSRRTCLTGVSSRQRRWRITSRHRNLGFGVYEKRDIGRCAGMQRIWKCKLKVIWEESQGCHSDSRGFITSKARWPGFVNNLEEILMEDVPKTEALCLLDDLDISWILMFGVGSFFFLGPSHMLVRVPPD